MRLTKEEGELLLGAISAELESQRYRQMRRDEYRVPLSREVERSLRNEDAQRADALRKVRDKIRQQL